MESELSGTSDGPLFVWTDIKAELETAAQLMTGFQKINILLVEVSTKQFAAYINNHTDIDTLPQTPARDFFLHSLQLNKFLEKIDNDYKVLVQREINKIAHMLDF